MSNMNDILELVGMAEARHRAECYDALVAACQIALASIDSDLRIPKARYTNAHIDLAKEARRVLQEALAKASGS